MTQIYENILSLNSLAHLCYPHEQFLILIFLNHLNAYSTNLDAFWLILNLVPHHKTHKDFLDATLWYHGHDFFLAEEHVFG